MKRLFLLLSFFAVCAFADDDQIRLDFQNADIETVAQVFAKLQGKNLIVDPRVKGSMSLVIKEKVTPEVAFGMFLSAIRLQGVSVIDADGFLRLIPQSDAASYSKTTAPLSIKGQYATAVFKISHDQSASIAAAVRPLISATGAISVSGQSLVVTDYADNLKRISYVIQSLDFSSSDFDIYQLKNSSALDLVPMLVKLLSASSSFAQQSALSSPSLSPTPSSSSPPAAPQQSALSPSSTPSQSPIPSAAPGSGVPGTSEVIADPRTNSVVIRAANALRLAQIRGLIQRLDLAPTSAGQSLRIVKLKNADASKVAPRLSVLFAGAMAIKIDFDSSINSLMVLATQEQFLAIRSALDDLDRRRPQVFIESMIVEINTDKSDQLGIDWSSANSWGKFSQSLGAATITSGIKFTSSTSLSVIAAALTRSGLGNILSTPTLMTLDNEEALILVGQNVPFLTGQYANNSQPQAQTGTVVPFQTIERRDIGLMLKVRPQVNESGTVRLMISQEVSSVDPGSTGSALGVTTFKRSITSNILAEDGATVILGGLLSDQSGSSVSQAPVIGDVPVLGWLFKAQSITSKKSNLALFVRPVVIRDAADADLLTDKYQSLQK